MRINIFLILFLCTSLTAFSQFKIGFQFSPSLSANRVKLESQDYNIKSDGTALKMAFGPIVDIPITDNYYVSSGLLYCSKRAGFEISDLNNVGPSVKEEYSLQYIQLPATMKLFTNEVSLDKKLYFQFGGLFEFNIKEEADKQEYVLVDDFRFFDLTILAGMGMEYQLGTSTIVFGGLSYHRGLINAISDDIGGLGGDLSLKNDYFSLDLGIKF